MIIFGNKPIRLKTTKQQICLICRQSLKLLKILIAIFWNNFYDFKMKLKSCPWNCPWQLLKEQNPLRLLDKTSEKLCFSSLDLDFFSFSILPLNHGVSQILLQILGGYFGIKYVAYFTIESDVYVFSSLKLFHPFNFVLLTKKWHVFSFPRFDCSLLSFIFLLCFECQWPSS